MSPTSTIIIGVDPGRVTGTSWWKVEEGNCYAWGQWPAYTTVVNLWGWLGSSEREVEGHGDVEVAVERFQIGPRTLQASRQYDALHVAGALRFKCQQLGIMYAEYPPSETKRLVTDERLQSLSAYVRGKGHVNDATRVALTHLARTRPVAFTALLDETSW